ncbi:peptidylprolyl isomerase [Flavihumibacter petaseus]|uniref:Peptidyl-prolyl cis-trans isomerase n=1 Tax=Flavihumibacter petaseus NBRC 106054 TaxID=1220578 RepID=A0A0E9MZD3_9BACT|nr:peptidylprolyl isomerase [Flavihumibacter petaseus]GAO42460.1 putative peptidyl-prolyl cis-trans isomerase [Flavihumibacter petaseus NBRC 106054]
MKFLFPISRLAAPAVISCMLLLFLAGCHPQSPQGNPRISIETPDGKIIIELFADKAPKTVAAFLALVDAGRYENTSFYRALTVTNQPSNAPKAELLQGGLWNRRKKRPTLPAIPHESTATTGIHHETGTISLARNEPGTGTSEFFICLTTQPGLDFGGVNNSDGQGYAAFGKVVEGMEVVYKIYQKPEEDQYLDPPVPIFNISRN